MAHLTYAQSHTTESYGNHQQDHKLVPDAINGFRYSDQRSASRGAASSSSHHTKGRGSQHSAAEQAGEEDGEEDSSTAHDEEQNEGDDPDILAPSYGFGRGGQGMGKHPAIRVEAVGGDESHSIHDETTSHVTGPVSAKHPVNQLLMRNKKRTFSDLSSTSVLFGDDSTDQDSFPRRKMARRVSDMTSTPLVTYKLSDDDTQMEGLENAIESDDEDYSGVNLVPDDDDSDVGVMEQEEESYILHEEQQATTLLNEFRDARRLSLESCASDNIFDVTAPLSNSYLSTYHDFGFSQFFEPEAVPASPDPATKRKYSDSSTKRVRFDDEVQISNSSSSESSELDDNAFPDLFLEQDKLPPVLHQLLEMDNDDDGDQASPMSDASFWDFAHDEARIAPATQPYETDDMSSSESSGYDSDMGDTTDEEDFGSDGPPRTPLAQQSVLRRPSSAAGSRATTPRPFQRNSRPVGRQIPPMRGVFIHDDSSKAIAITNRTTKAVTFYRPRPSILPWIPLHDYRSSTSSTANDSPRTSITHVNASDSEVSNEIFNHVLGTDIMLTGIFGSAPGNDFFFGNESIGPPEAFYPFVSIGANGNMNIMEDDHDDDSDDYEDDLNITDFMDFGSEAEDTDVDQDDDETDGNSRAVPSASNPSTPQKETPGTRKRSTSDVMLEHFDRGVVTAFRNNQSRYRDVASLPSDPAARASVSRPVRSGKSAEALITPLRKRSRSNRVTKSAPHGASNVSKASSRLRKTMMQAPRGRPPRMGTFS